MAETPNITITVDEEALRSQVQRIIRDELHRFAGALFRASRALDPEFHKEHEAWVRASALRLFEAERTQAGPRPTEQEST